MGRQIVTLMALILNSLLTISTSFVVTTETDLNNNVYLFPKKADKHYSKLEIHGWNIELITYHLFQNKSDDCLNLYIRNLKNLRFSVRNIHLNLCGQVENSKWILCSRKTGVKGAKLYFSCKNNLFFEDKTIFVK